MIYTLEQSNISEAGPEALYSGSTYQEVFLNQGSLDGACGPYSVFMALLALGLVERQEATSYIPDGRTRLGKLMKKLNEEHLSLFRYGTDLTDLENIIGHTFGTLVGTESTYEKNKDIVKFTIGHLQESHPTIVGVNFSSGSHWMLAVGYELNEESENVNLLLLDPAGTKPTFAHWNSIIDLRAVRSKKYAYNWMNMPHNIQFEHALALWRR